MRPDGANWPSRLTGDVSYASSASFSSTMFIEWMRAIGGRIKFDLRFSNTFVYNSFPLPSLSRKQMDEVSAAARRIIEVRAGQAGRSLATLYDPDDMPDDLVGAHERVDAVVDKIFGTSADVSLADRQRLLFRRYAELAG